MSLSNRKGSDAFSIRDGAAVFSIHHFGSWEDVDELTAQLSEKLDAVFDELLRPAIRMRTHGRLIRIECVFSEQPPSEVRALCARRAVKLDTPRPLE